MDKKFAWKALHGEYSVFYCICYFVIGYISEGVAACVLGYHDDYFSLPNVWTVDIGPTGNIGCN